MTTACSTRPRPADLSAAAQPDEGRPIPLRRGDLRPLANHARGYRITCTRGIVWVTEPNNPQDIILHRGEVAIVGGAHAVVQALTDAIVAVVPL